eukprot:3128158-Pyramimonas_sp.AAC.1
MASTPQPLLPDKEGGDRRWAWRRAAEPVSSPPWVGLDNSLADRQQSIERVRSSPINKLS